VLLNRTTNVRQRSQSVEGTENEEQRAANEDISRQQHAALNCASACSVHLQPPPLQRCGAENSVAAHTQADTLNTPHRNLRDLEAQEIDEERESSRDSRSMSLDSPRSSPKSPAIDYTDADAHLQPGEVSQNADRQASSEPAHNENNRRLSMPPDPEAMDTSPERKYEFQRNSLVLSIQRHDVIQATEISAAADQIGTAHLQHAAAKGPSHDIDIIDLCSDDEDAALAESFQSKIEQTPDFEEVSPPRQSTIPNSDDGTLRWSTLKRKYDVIQIASDDDNENEVLEAIDGDAWRRAFLRHSQVKKSGSEE
jgi:hypothetical protein